MSSASANLDRHVRVEPIGQQRLSGDEPERAESCRSAS